MANYRQTGREDEIDRQNINKPAAGGGGNGQAVQVSDTGNVTREPVSTSGANNQAANGFQVSDTVRQAQQMLQQQMAAKPGQYQSTWQGQLDEILGKILNREDFSYDLNGDALYQQYKDQYTLQGRQAMMDTMGQAAALTGGYGNSYAQTVGQQTYQGYLQQLNDRIPELYQLALSKYQMESDALMDQYALLGAQDDRDYGRYRDGMSDYYQNLSFLTDAYRDQRDFDYGKYADQRDFAYGQERDQAADRQWQAEFDEAKRRYDQEWAESHPEEEEERAGSYLPYDQTPDEDVFDNEGLSENQIKMIQYALGLPDDGRWGAAERAAAGGLGAKEAYDAWFHGKLGKPVGDNIKEIQEALGMEPTGVWSAENMAATNGMNADDIYRAYLEWMNGGK